jgi:choline dehydrogenase-like flavoprotein
LCAGAVGTPAILYRSGLLPRSGRFQVVDHPSVAFDVGRLPQRFACGDADRRRGAGPWAPSVRSQVGSVIRFASSSGHGAVADIEVTVVEQIEHGEPVGHIDKNADGPTADRSVGSVIVALLQPRSVGWLQPSEGGAGHEAGGRTLLPFTAVTNALAHPDDREDFRRGLRRVARWLTEAADRLGAEAALGSVAARTLGDLADDRLDQLLVAWPGPVAHLAASCPLGSADRAAAMCHAEPGRMGQVRGLEGLRLGDSSLLPGLISGGLQIPVTAVAYRVASDLAA